MNWNSHAPVIWKIATLKSLIKRAFLISSTKGALEKELAHIQQVFCDLNDYPPKLVDTIIRNERSNLRQQQSPTEVQGVEQSEEEKEEKPVELMLNLPYAGDKGETIISKLKKCLTSKVNKTQKKIKISAVYKATKIGSRFNIKDKINFKNQHNVVYHADCPNRKCKSNYVGQTKCRMEKRGGQHGSDEKSHL